MARPGLGYPRVMRSRPPTRWLVAAFIVLGALVALFLMVRDLGNDDEVTEETGTRSVLVGG